ncbi:unnamed protein product [Caretta caretta]
MLCIAPLQEDLEHLRSTRRSAGWSCSWTCEARTTYRRILSEPNRKLNTQVSQIGNCVEKVQPYYEARRLAKEAQQEM